MIFPGKIKGKNANTSSIFYNQREVIPFFIDKNLKTRHLLIKGMEEVVTGSIGGIAGPGEACPPKRPLGDFPFFGSGKKGPPVFHFDDPLDSLPAHYLHGILIRQIVAPFDCIKGVIFPCVFHRKTSISQGGVNPTLSSYGVRSKGGGL
jgi:hypothetical protein